MYISETYNEHKAIPCQQHNLMSSENEHLMAKITRHIELSS